MDSLQLHVNSRVQQNISRQREMFASGGMGLDQKHDRIWCQFGYPEHITPEMLRFAFERQSPVFAVVSRVLSKTWETMPEIIENEGSNDKIDTPWEKLVNKIMSRAYPAIIDADRKNLINRYSALIVRFRDSRPLDQPVDTSLLKRQKENSIVGYIPAWQEQLTPVEWDTNETSDDYGKVLMWSFNEAAVASDNNGAPVIVRNVHHSRIIILAEGSHDGNHSNGTSRLEASFNPLIDMQKSRGGSNESVFKNSGRQLHVNYDAEVTVDQLIRQMGLKTKDELRDKLNSDVDAVNQSIDAAMFTFGAEVTPLSVAPTDPTPAWTVAANEYSAAWTTPFTIIFGQQTGRLASDQDQIDHNTMGSSRRVNFVNTIIRSVIDMFAKYGIIESREDYLIKWDSLIEPSPMQKAETFGKLATANKAVFESNFKPALTIDEMRQAAGYEPLGEDELPEGAKEETPPADDVTK